MRLHRLAVTAFGPFAEPQEIDFDALSGAGIFLLHGPTGAGKTSVLDAVCYALYGSVPGARQAPGTTLRSDHAAAGTPTEVTLELTAGGRRLEITRRPEQERPKKRGTGTTKDKAQSRLREHTGAGWEPLSRSHQEIGEEIEQLLGMSREQFCQVVLLPQGEFARFLRADEAARGRLLGRLFDTRRFAAVETLLGERRRAAEARVRAGDEKVLHTAQRLAQAAGDSADLRAWPLPGHQPGDPGLAGAVRAWAAVARCSARERLDVAEYALAAVESRHAAARRAAEDARELDRLQRRHAETTRRAALLAEAEPERERVRGLLDGARRGALVAPALELRGAAGSAHLAAAHAETTARAELPPPLREAGAEQLATVEQRLREELGALGAARRTEQRSAEIGRERADLERESRAAEEQRQESVEWLERWEETRSALQERADAAQQAATLAEQLAGRLEPARMNLNAARRRDEFAADAERAENELLDLREESAAARERWLELKEARLRGIAAELAEALVAGEACTVCGSAEHPAPARPAPGHVDRAAEDAAHAAFERAEQARAAVERSLAAAREARAEAASDAVLPDYERTALQHRLDAWQAEEALLADRLGETGTADAAALPPAAPDAAEAYAAQAAAKLRTAGSACDAARVRCAELDRLSRQTEQELRALGPLREAYDRVARLAGLTAGTSADNERKMRLEAYVLAARLEQVAAAATVRLLRMSGGRYTLVHSDARASGRGRSGLGLHVVDAWTGSERDTATLSGGETFFASLALALGLADVVTDEAGGTRLDTLFIDEGFGSLDDQALDEVLDVLDSLRERDRSVGIVSHVADLRTRVQAQLEIVKQRGGSVVRHRTAALTD
ncbi:AAA family ATPase [Streptomyces yangpuensis]|uniref:AAA family ATPase n=1 Tax=Streptomyces yangpuensis TaxID=1648182 RepID=UPI0036856BA8